MVFTTLNAKALPENVLTKSCLNSYFNSYKNKTDHKAFVYARESDTGKDRCGWGYGHKTAKEAKKTAMKQCASFQLNAECIIVDVDGEYLVKEGDFTLISQPDDTPLSEVDKEKLLNEVKTLIRGNCLPFFNDYLKDKGHKAFGYSLDADGKFACGKIYGSSTMVAAKNGAIKGCQNNKNKRGKKKPKSPCKLYAEGNKILLQAKDFGIVGLPTMQKELTEEGYASLFNEAKTMIKKGPCLFQMKYYLKGFEHQAFFLAQDKEGKQVCGRSEEALTLDVALDKALKACNENLSKVNMEAKCLLIAKNFDMVGDASLFVKENKAESKKSDDKNTMGLFNAVKYQEKWHAKTETKPQNKPIDMNKPSPLNETLQITADTLNKDLPTMLDTELRLDKVSAKDHKMYFDYTLVNFTPASMSGERLKSLMYEDVKTQVCIDKEMVELLKKGMSVDYVYRGKEKKDIITFAFDAKVCGVVTNVEQIKKNILNMIHKK